MVISSQNCLKSTGSSEIKIPVPNNCFHVFRSFELLERMLMVRVRCDLSTKDRDCPSENMVVRCQAVHV